MRVDRRNGKLKKSSLKTVGQWLDEWLEVEAKHRLQPTTLERYRGIVDHYLKPDLGKRRLDRLTPLEITKARNLWLKGVASKDPEKKRKALKPRTVIQHLAVLHRALADARRLGEIPFNPADDVEMPRADYFEYAVLDAERARKAIQGARGTALFAPVIIALATGLRRGEICALRWSDVDLKAGTVSVTKSVAETKAGRYEKEPKSRSGRRVVPLPGLRDRGAQEDRGRAEGAAPGASRARLRGAVRLPEGRRWRTAQPRHPLKPVADLREGPGLRGHASPRPPPHLWDAPRRRRSEPAALSKTLGHSSPTSPAKQYVHPQASAQERLAERMDSMLKPRPQRSAKSSNREG